MEQLNNCFKIIVTFILTQGENMLPEVKDAIARKCRNILTRLKEPVEGPGASVEPLNPPGTAIDPLNPEHLEKRCTMLITEFEEIANAYIEAIDCDEEEIEKVYKQLKNVFKFGAKLEESLVDETTDADGNPNPPVSETTEDDDKPVVAP